MSSELDPILEQYGLAPDSAPGTLLSPFNASLPTLDGAAREAAVMDHAQRALPAVRAALHRGASIASYLPAPVGVTAQVVAQETKQPSEPRTASVDPAQLASELVRLIAKHESGDDYTAKNKHSTASGAYQYTNPTWGDYAGYSTAAAAPRRVQDRRAMQDVQKRLKQYGGDPFKAIAAHYLPVAANDPATWGKPYTLPSGKTVAPVAQYVRQTVEGTPLQGRFDEYITQYTR